MDRGFAINLPLKFKTLKANAVVGSSVLGPEPFFIVWKEADVVVGSVVNFYFAWTATDCWAAVFPGAALTAVFPGTFTSTMFARAV